MSPETLVLLAVVGARFLVPLLIPRFPLPGIIAALVLDAVDQTVFQLLGYDPPGYQGYDKAMDVYYLAVAYLATLRNWTSGPALQVARFLYFYRLIGVVAFELSGWRPMLLLFPNTFEYFFIAYELVRLRRNPARYDLRFWVLVAGGIWVLVKLPQEWWIHVAKLDVTDTVAAYPWLGVLAAAALAVAGLIAWTVVRPRLSAPDWSWRIAADPLPQAVAAWRDRAAWVAERGRVLSVGTGEKILLVGLISIVYAEVLPGVRSTNLQLFVGLGVFVVLNAAISLSLARGVRGTDSMLLAFSLRVVMNSGLVLLADALLSRRGGGLNLAAALFFVFVLSLLTLLDDRFRPAAEVRADRAGEGAGSAGRERVAQ
jgi:hypothetical protein